MNSFNPYPNHPSSFLNLLTSQQQNQTIPPIQLEHFPPSIDLGSSDVPVFSTQLSDDQEEEEARIPGKKSRCKWSPTEDWS